MAEASLANSLVDDFLTCKICFDVFEEPKILPCLHTFCLKCLTKHHKGLKDRLSCPMCRDESLISKEGISGFKTNFYVKNLIELVQTKDLNSPRQKCLFCFTNGKEREAMQICLDCQDALCNECASLHNFTRITMDHKVVGLNEIHTGKFDEKIRSMQVIRCQHHPQESIRFFCETCNIPVCPDCVLLTHKLHDCLTTEEAIKTRMEIISGLTKSLDEKLQQESSVDHRLKRQLSEFEMSERKVISDINDSTMSIIEKVKLESTEAQSVVRRVFMKPKDEVSQKIRKSNELVSSIKESLRFCTDAIHNCKGAELLFMYDELRERLDQLQSIPSSSLKPSERLNEFKSPKFEISAHFKQKLNIFEVSHAEARTVSPCKTQSTHINKHVDNPLTDAKLVSTRSPSVPFTFVRKITNTQALKKPNLTSVVWMNATKFAVVDSENETVDIFSFDTLNDEKIETKTLSVKQPINLTFCNNMLICGSNHDIHLIDKDYKISSFNVCQSTGPVSLAKLKDSFLVGKEEKNKLSVYQGMQKTSSIDVKDENGKKLSFDPISIAVTSKAEIVILNRLLNNILLVGKDGRITRRFVKFADQMSLPGALCLDKYNNILVSDCEGSSVIVLAEAGKIITSYNLKPNIQKPVSLSVGDNGYLIITGSGGYIGIYKCNYPYFY